MTRQWWMFAVVAGLAGTACLDEKVEPGKGVLEAEQPPGSAAAPREGKADGGGIVVAVDVQSPHPYANDLDRVFPIALEGRVPSCAARARVHFASIRTEAGYDHVRLEGPRGVVESFDGERTDLWTSWVELDATKTIGIRLETDGSITRDGFRIDAVEVETAVVCPAVAIRVCAADQLDTNPSRGTCECPRQPTCVAEDAVTLEHVIGGGFTGAISGHRVTGDTAYAVRYTPSGPAAVDPIGTIDHARVQAVVRAVADARLLERSSVLESGNWIESLTVTVGAATRTFSRPQGTFPTADAALIGQLEGLFACGAGAPLTCGAGYACQDGQCLPAPTCVCTEQYEPVCGVDGRTYGNACEAGCATTAVRHPGVCGIEGDRCGGLDGAACADGFKCRYGTSQFTAPFPDAGGRCVAGTYCDAPADCTGLPHVAVPGAWACEASRCAWKAGPAWTAVTGWAFVSNHPYGNRASQWKQLDAPAGARKVRLRVVPPFELEAGYDFLEVWARNASGEWVVIKRYTGNAGPALTDEFAGRSFWLRLASDASITRYGFDLTAEWAY